VGGKPNHAIYFVGAEGGREGGREGGVVVGLDPHTVQSAPLPQNGDDNEEEEEEEERGREGGRKGFAPTDEHLRSVQCRTPQVMQAKDLDPSLALGFYVRNEVDFHSFISHAHALKKSLMKHKLPVPFCVEQAPPEYEGAMMQSLVEEGEGEGEEEGEGEGEEDEEDEYVIISAG
jgi:hypothetical protein